MSKIHPECPLYNHNNCKELNNPKRDRVYGADRDHLGDIKPDDLPENRKIVYESVIDRLRSARPIGDLGEDKADHLAVDILYMANVVKAKCNP